MVKYAEDPEISIDVDNAQYEYQAHSGTDDAEKISPYLSVWFRLKSAPAGAGDGAATTYLAKVDAPRINGVRGGISNYVFLPNGLAENKNVRFVSAECIVASRTVLLKGSEKKGELHGRPV